MQSLTCGAFTGTLDFSANNNNVTVSASGGFNNSGSGTRTVNLGNGTFTLTNGSASWTMTTTTNLTFNANSSVIVFSNVASANTRTFAGGGKTYSTVTLGSNTSSGNINSTGSNTFATLNITAPNNINFVFSTTATITNAPAWSGSVGSYISLRSNTEGSLATISVASGTSQLAWAAIKDMTFSGGATFLAGNSFDLSGNTGITITPPTMTRSRGQSGFA